MWLLVLLSLALGADARPATGRLIKVLPELLDLKGRNTVAPSLYERDAYQVVLRNHPERRSGVRFYIQCKVKGEGRFKVRAELLGSATGTTMPKPLVLEHPTLAAGWFGQWITLTVTGDAYKKLGLVTAWRVTLWDGDRLLSEQHSFLWQAGPPQAARFSCVCSACS